MIPPAAAPTLAEHKAFAVLRISKPNFARPADRSFYTFKSTSASDESHVLLSQNKSKYSQLDRSTHKKPLKLHVRF